MIFVWINGNCMSLREFYIMKKNLEHPPSYLELVEKLLDSEESAATKGENIG